MLMDDIRRPYRGERRDYAIPAHRQAPVTDLRPAAPPAPNPRPPQPIQAQSVPPAPAPHHAHHQTHQAHHAQQPAYQVHRQPAPQHLKKTRRVALLPVVAVLILAAAASFGGYLLLKPHKTATFTPASLAKQAGFPFYYPQPLPAGYSYVDTINTFEAGQAYYMIARGSRHIIIKEQASSSQSLDLSSLSQPATFTSAAGKAATGTNSGQPAGLLLTNSTLITLNSTGQVSPADISSVINNLKPMAKQ